MIRLSPGSGKLVLRSLVGALFCAGAVFCFYAVPRNVSLHADHEKTLARLNAQVARAYELPGDAANISGNQYSGFGHVSTVLTDLQTTSFHSGLSVLDATCRPVEIKEHTNFGQVQINTRMKGNYKDIKNVISKLLAAHEGLSLDTLSFRRACATDPQLDAEVRMTFYYKKDA
jgi:hypothetical protein